jgi:predicted alpha/beta hydrolase
MRPITLHAHDGFALSGTVYGDTKTAHSALLIAPAMGVSQRYYAAFAQWLAEQGYVVLSFDYRGMGLSRPQAFANSLRGFNADVVTWAEQDAAAALAWLASQVDASKPLVWLGHSLGAQILGLVPGRERVTHMVTIGAGTGYWRENTRKLKSYVWWLWYFLVPTILPLFGYFPGRSLRKVGDLPAGVMAQWRRWCLQPDYLMSEGGNVWRSRYAELSLPILSLSFTDDEYMSLRNTESLHSFYAGSRRTMRRIAPNDVAAPRIGHFGFFKTTFAATLWPQVATWLQQPALDAL